MIYTIRFFGNNDIFFEYDEIEDVSYVYEYKESDYGNIGKRKLSIYIKIKALTNSNGDDYRVRENIQKIKELINWSQNKYSYNNLEFIVKDMNNMKINFSELYISSLKSNFNHKDGNGVYEILLSQKFNVAEKHINVEE